MIFKNDPSKEYHISKKLSLMIGGRSRLFKVNIRNMEILN